MTGERADDPVMDQAWPAFDPGLYPRTYRPGPLWMLLLLGFGAAVATVGLGALGARYLASDAMLLRDLQALPPPLALALLAAGLYVIVDTLKTRLVLHADAVEIFDARQPRRVRFEDLAGLRYKLASNAPITLVLVPKPGLGRKFRVPLLFQPDFAFHAWMRRLEDLDAADLARSWQAVKQNPAYGRDEPQRLRRLRWASHVPRCTWVLLAGLFMWSLWSERPPAALLVALALAPCVLLALAGFARGLLRLDDRRNDVRPSLANVWAIACLASLPALLLATNLVAWGAAWAWGLGAGVLMGALAMHWAARTQGSPLHLVVMIPVLCVYCTVALAWLNVQADRTSAHVHRTVVAAKNTHRGRVRSYTLRVDPWGPFQEAQRIYVDRERFNTVSPGETVCMLLHPGRLGWAWYDVAACGQKDGEDPIRQAIERRLRQMAYGPERQGPLLRLLVAQRFDALDQHVGDLQRQFEQGQRSDHELLVALRDFYDPDPALDPLLDHWVERFPASYAALLARGIHRKYQAMALQSAGFVPAMSPRLHAGQYQALQVLDLERSTQLTAKPVLSYVHLMDAAVSPRQDERLRVWLDRGLAVDPDSLVLRRKYLALLRPMHGGSLDVMEAFAQDTRRRGAPASVLNALEAMVVMQRGWARQNGGDEQAALALFHEAAGLGLIGEDLNMALRQEADILIRRNQFAEALAVLDRALQADPDQPRSLGMRGYALERLNRVPEALAAYERAAQLRDRWSQTHLGQIYLQGQGVAPDHRRAAQWLALAAEAGDEEAKKALRQHPDLSPRPQ